MRRSIFLAPFCLIAGCSEPMALLSSLINGAPPSGIYATAAGEAFRVSTTGPTPLNVRSADGALCLMFWRETVQRWSDLTTMKGQTCGNSPSDGLVWYAAFPENEARTIYIYPPGRDMVARGRYYRLRLKSLG